MSLIITGKEKKSKTVFSEFYKHSDNRNEYYENNTDNVF